MSSQRKYAALAATMALLCGSASAQISTRDERAAEFARSVPYADYLKERDLRASELVGARVSNANGDNLGEIEELVIPNRDRDDMLVIVSVGGVLDVHDKLVALPYDDLRVSLEGDHFYFDRTKEQLEAAPVFTYERQAEARAATQPATATNGTTPDRPRATASPVATAAKSSNLVLDVFDYRASDLVGAAVLDDRGENVGKVDDIVVSTDDDALHAVLAIGGFLGFGAKLISMPLDDLQITSNGDSPQVRIKMTGEQLNEVLAARPEFHYGRPQVAQAPGNSPRG